MNKIHLVIGVMTLTLAVGFYFVVNNSQPKQSVTNPTTPATTTEIVTSSTEASEEERLKYVEIDLAKLPGKDRLYTDEEGRFENLSEGEQMVLIEAYHCRDYESRGKKFCKQHAVIYDNVSVENVRLLALRDGMAVVYVEDENDSLWWLYVYDLAKQELIRKFVDTGNTTFGVDTTTWQTCHNHLQGYQISYPSDWFVIVGEEDAMPKTAEECDPGVRLMVKEPFPSTSAGPYLFVERLPLPYADAMSHQEYLTKHSTTTTYANNNMVALLTQNSFEDYEFLIFGNQYVWKITVKGKSREFAEGMVGTFRILK